MPDDERNLLISRGGKQFGPYPEHIARTYLANGQLLETDHGWYEGAQEWSPLAQLLNSTPPPPPPAPAPDPDVAVHVSRNGENFGPYQFATAKQYFNSGQLQSTDRAWHEGMDEWKPLGDVLKQSSSDTCPQCNTALESGAVMCMSCGFNTQTGKTVAIDLNTPGTMNDDDYLIMVIMIQ